MGSRFFTIIFLILTLSGCPVYDPITETGMLKLINQSDETFYVCITCENVLSEKNKVFYQLSWGENSYDEFGNKKNGKFYPNDRLEPSDTAFFGGYGKNPKKPKIICEKGRLNLFFISESDMRDRTWEEISRDQIYSYKRSFSQKELDSLNWVFKFH